MAESSSKQRIPVVDPRSGRQFASIADQGPVEVAQAVARARSAYGAWGPLSYTERAEHILRVRDLLLDRIDLMVETIVEETGKLPGEAVMHEVLTACEVIDYYARHGHKALRPQRVSSGLMLHKRMARYYEPRGVVAVISPWNYPFVLALTPVVTAMFAGNAVVLKPSEVTSLTGLAIGDLFRDVGGHRDLVQVVTGGGATGDALVRSEVDLVCFTGSAATGKKVMAAAAQRLTPVVLELGGKDPMIVRADADLDRAASGAVWGAFQNSGQTCMSVERVYVQDSVYDEFVDKVVTRTKAVKQGDKPGNDIGSMTFAPQVDIIEAHLADAVDRGATVLTGGQRVPGREGLWFEPTVVVGVDHSMQLMRDETFGPVLPIMAVADDDEAVRLANDSVYGLNSSVWTSDPTAAARIAGELEAGNVCVNDAIDSYAVPALPFGGVKDSGMGRMHGPEGLQTMSNVKSVLTDRFGPPRELWWYPTLPGLGTISSRLLVLRYRRGWRAKLGALSPRSRR